MSDAFENDEERDEDWTIDLPISAVVDELVQDRTFIDEIALLVRRRELVSARGTGNRYGKYAQRQRAHQTPVRRLN